MIKKYITLVFLHVFYELLTVLYLFFSIYAVLFICGFYSTRSIITLHSTSYAVPILHNINLTVETVVDYKYL